MRDFKCIAFYKPLKQMLGPEQIESINFDTKVLGVYMEMDGKGYHKLRMSDFEIMWYTGLQDRDGNEIFEGDIILDDSYGEDVGRLIDSVVWNNETGAWVWGKDEVALIAESVDTIVVIGNIYKNSDLLEVTNE